RFEIGNRHRGMKTGHGDDTIVVRDRNHIVAVGRVYRDRVDRPVAAAAAYHSEIDVDVVDAGAGQVVDRHIVGAGKGPEVDGFDIVGIHRDVGHVAEERGMRTIRRDRDVLGDIGAIELQYVAAPLAVNDIAAVARVPGEHVIAVAQQSRVVPGAAGHEI